MYMYKFKPILKTMLWGGEKIVPYKRIVSDQKQVGESWELSGVKGNESVVAEGPEAGTTLPLSLIHISSSEATPRDKEYISVKADYKVSLVRIAEIIYLESEGEYVRMHLADGSTITTLFRLKNMETALPAESFMRVHRSYIVNLRAIKAYVKGRIFLSDNEYIPIGENYKEAFQAYIDKNFRNL